MRCFCRGTVVVVGARCVVGNIGDLGQERSKGIGVRFCGEESVYIARSAQKSRFVVADAGDCWVWAQRQRWKSSLIRDWSVGIPWIGSGAGGNPAFMFAREVSIRPDILIVEE
jgi:hypothetical protein